MAVTLEEIIFDYYDLLGEDEPSVPTTQDLRVVNRTMEEIVRRHKFGFTRATQSLSLVSLQASLASVFNHIYDVRYRYSGDQDDVIFKMVDEASKDDFTDPIFWITGDTQQGWKLNTNMVTYNPLSVTYYRRPGWIGSMSDVTFFPYTEPIALGAYLRRRKIDNPDVDINQEKGEYEQSLASLISYDQRLNGRQGRYKGLHEAGGYVLGVD